METGTHGQKLLYREMNVSNAIGLILYGCPVDVSLAICNQINSDCKKGSNFSHNKSLVIGSSCCGTDAQ